MKKLPLFYKVFFPVLAAFIIAAAIGLIIVWNVLADYEAMQPSYEAQRVFDKLYGADYSELSELIGQTKYETESDIARGLKSAYSDKKLTFSKSETKDNGDLVYDVCADDVVFSSFTLSKTGNKTKFGFETYSLSSATALPCISVKLKVPSYCICTLNGFEVSDNAFTETYETISCKHIPDGTSGLIYKLGSVDGLYAQPVLSVIDRTGVENELITNDDGYIEALPVYDSSLQEAYSDFATGCAKAYACYMQKDGTFASVAKYMDKSSLFYKQVRAVEFYFVLYHYAYEFENVKASEFYAYDENTFSCRVKLTQVLKRSGQDDHRDNIDTTYFLRKVNGEYRVYDSQNN